MPDKFPINKSHKSYKGYSGSAGRSYSSSRQIMGKGGGGGKGPINKPPKKKGCPLWVLIWVVAPGSALALGIAMILDSIHHL